MKFGKEYVSQMVHEWQEAYMDYNHLKSLLMEILNFKKKNAPLPEVAATPRGSLKRRVSMYRAFSGLQIRYNSFKGKNNHEDEVIVVNSVQQEGSESHYETTFLVSCEEGGECELNFFRSLDDEFNKVLTFYKKKVGEVKVEAEALSKQMDALIALRIKVDKISIVDQVIDTFSNEDSVFSPASVDTMHFSSPGRPHMEAIQEVEMNNEEILEQETVQEVEMTSEEILEEKAKIGKRDTTEMIPRDFRPAPVEVLDYVKINIEPETPISTLRCIMTSKPNLSFSKEELRKVEEQMKKAFVEFYQKLRLLKRYSSLNVLAFSKIMKKYDKISSRKASKSYLEVIEKSYLRSSDEVLKLMEGVEVTFIKHFVDGNRKKGMKYLRPQAQRETHRVTFLLGLFSGCSLALVAAIAVSIRAGTLLENEDRGQYMENIFPLYSLFGFVVLHIVMYGANIYYWRRFRVNYPFIFGFKQGTELGYRQVLLLASGLSLLALAAALYHLDMDIDPETQSFQTLTELTPLALVIVQAIRSLQFYVCYYGWGNFRERSNTCQESKIYPILYIFLAIIPFWSRFIQCLRRVFEERDLMQGFNSLKYLSTVVALVMRTLYDQKRGTFWRVMAASTSGITTVGNTYWDLVVDWGLLQRNSKNPWLRDKLLVPYKSVYFVAIVLNIILRLVWMQLVLDFQQLPFLHRRAFIALVACLEILRRGMWNFFRLENEHLNNVGKYRASESVPLPFNYDEDKSM